MMCKPWSDAVSQRILLRKASEEPVPLKASAFLAMWDKPSGKQVSEFFIDEAGIVS